MEALRKGKGMEGTHVHIIARVSGYRCIPYTENNVILYLGL
jgi:hypothetical protein